jgi:aminoglycoside phosphotransferase (APT) family kinase protein
MTDPVSLRQAAARLLGPCELIAVLAEAVIRVETASGEEFAVKQHLNRTLHEREVHAYRHWTTALGPSAPVLIAVDDAAMIMATSALPGASPNASDLTPDVYRQAGVLLRRFHEAEPPTAMPGYRGWLRERAAHWASRAAPLLTPDDRAIIQDHLAAVGQPDIPSGGPCHLDFQPRNWLIGSPGDVSVIDFEHARIDLPARDLVRLRFRTWPGRPDLRDAFLDGYGRPPSPAEDRLTWHLGALDALTALARGHENADPELVAVGRDTLRQLWKEA